MTHSKIRTGFISVAAVFGLTLAMALVPTSSPSHAATNYQDHSQTHPAVHLTPDKSEIIRLNRPAARVILGNEQHLSIFIDSPERIVLVPRTPGATFFTVLGENGDIIMQRHAIIGSPQKNYIRVRNSCNGGNGDCQNTRVYYCPDMCHQIAIPSADDTAPDNQDLNAAPMSSTNSSNTTYQELP